MPLPGSITYDSPAAPPGGGVFLSKANNGLSLSSVTPGEVVLGQNVAQAGNPAALISAREIPQATFGLNIFGGGVSFSQSRMAALAHGVQINLDPAQGGNILQVGNTTHSLFAFQNDGLLSINDVNTGASGIAMKSRRFVNAPLGTFLTETFSITSTWQPDNSQDPAEITDMEIGSRVVLPNLATVDYTGWLLAPSLSQAVGAGGNIRAIWYRPTYLAGPLANQHIALQIETGDTLFNTDTGSVNGISRTGFQGVLTPTAFVEIGIGDGSPGTGQLKLDPTTILGAPEDGVLEYSGAHLFFTIGAVRHQLV